MAARVRVVLQSRLSSSRLPGKAMLSVAGRPAVVLAALRAGNRGAEVVVATSDRAEDDVIADAVGAVQGVVVVRGPLDDPLARFVLAAEGLAGDDVVLRLTGDNVVPDGTLVDLLVEGLAARGADAAYVRIGGDDPALPYGVAGEAFTAALLRTVDREATDPFDREHVTPMMRARVGDHRLVVPDLRTGWAGLRCTVDTFDDYVRVCRVFTGVEDAVAEPWRGLCDRVQAATTAVRPWPSRAGGSRQGPLVLGTVQLGVAYGAANAGGLPDAATAAAVLTAAAEQGITHLDTARAYGESEARVGAALARGLSEHVAVVTKVAPLPEVTTNTEGAALVAASVQTSLHRLGVPRVDALLLHRAADWHRPGVRDALVALREEGAARVVGTSLSTPDELVSVLADPDCAYVQLPFNLLDRRWLAPEVHDALAARPDVVVTCRSAYLQGLLVSREARWPGGHDGRVVHAGLEALCAELGRASWADLCLAYVLGHDWVTSVVVGAESAEQVRDSAALVRKTPLTPDELARVREVLAAGAEDLIDPSRWRQP